MAVQSLATYHGQAEQQYDPTYNGQVNALKGALATKLAGFNTQKVGVNSGYDGQINSQNVQNTATKNNYSDTELGRGMGRSSIVSSGLAGLDDQNARVDNNINTARNTDVNGINQSIANANADNATQVQTLQSDKENQVMTLARQLLATATDNDFKQQNLDLSKQTAAQDAALKAAQTSYYNKLAAGGGGSSSGYSYGSSGGTTSAKSGTAAAASPGTATLKAGMSGTSVAALQKTLGLSADGVFGESTRRALIEFQKQAGLTADGIAGAQTLAALGSGSPKLAAYNAKPSQNIQAPSTASKVIATLAQAQRTPSVTKYNPAPVQNSVGSVLNNIGSGISNWFAGAFK